MTPPSLVFLLSSNEPTNATPAAPLGRGGGCKAAPEETKSKWHQSSWQGASDPTVRPGRIVSSVIPSHSQIFILTRHYLKVLAQEARKVVTTLILTTGLKISQPYVNTIY